MRPELNDVRLLKLAEMYETAFETFVVEMATKMVADPEVRRHLMGLVAPEDAHPERVRKEARRLSAGFGPADRAGLAYAAVLDIRDVERAARQFYVTHADEVHDPHVARLFRALAAEEDRHVRMADEALRMLERGGVEPEAETVERLRLARDDAIDLFEGVGDIGTDVYSGGPRRRPERNA